MSILLCKYQLSMQKIAFFTEKSSLSSSSVAPPAFVPWMVTPGMTLPSLTQRNGALPMPITASVKTSPNIRFQRYRLLLNDSPFVSYMTLGCKVYGFRISPWGVLPFE